jgi:phage recombination protein Bet
MRCAPCRTHCPTKTQRQRCCVGKQADSFTEEDFKMSNAVAKTDVSNVPAKSPSLVARFGARYAVDPSKVMGTLKATCFKGNVSDEQMMALLIVADQYGLNPFTKEIYAFPDKNNGIVPVVGVDGWIRIINSNPDFESMTFLDGELDEKGIPVFIECTITLKNRAAPMVVKEYFAECSRNTGPWQSHPRRMLRHKAIIQCARLALGFVGIYDPDEAERVANAIDVTPVKGKPKTEAPRARVSQDEPAATITLDQSTMLSDKITEEGVELSLFLASFQIGTLEDLPAARFDDALKAIDQLSKG